MHGTFPRDDAPDDDPIAIRRGAAEIVARLEARPPATDAERVELLELRMAQAERVGAFQTAVIRRLNRQIARLIGMVGHVAATASEAGDDDPYNLDLPTGFDLGSDD